MPELDSRVRVLDWGPPTNGWEFRVLLEQPFALRASQRELTDFEKRRFQEIGVSAVKKFYPDVAGTPYDFYKGTLLLRSVDLRLSLPSLFCPPDPNLKKDIFYKTEEVRTEQEATALLTLYSRWKEHAWAFLSG